MPANANNIQLTVSATGTGACLGPPALSDCSWIWVTVGYPNDIHFQVSWRNGRKIREKVPTPDGSGYEWEERCGYSSINYVDVYCTNCGHPCEEPVLVSLQDGEYTLTNTQNGVWFDLSGDGVPQRLPWTARGSDDAFLVLDRNANGAVDDGRELFSHVTPQPPLGHGEVPHGFRALAVFDEPLNAGNSDGLISQDDLIYPHLRLWRDADHDGQTDPGELLTLAMAGVQSLSLTYTDANEHLDRHGNIFKFSAPVRFLGGRKIDAWVVYFNLETCPNCDLVGPFGPTDVR